MKYTLPVLTYAYDALEPYLDAKTMEVHHSKHHQTYVDKLNAVLDKYPEVTGQTVPELLVGLTNLTWPEADKKALVNHGGGTINHNLFWEIMGPAKEIDQALVSEIEVTFGTLADFKQKFSDLSIAQFGSGWTWLVRDQENKLQIYSTSNQDSPYLQNHTPIFCLDVWEHAYYLKFQNRRADYIKSWWNVLKLLP